MGRMPSPRVLGEVLRSGNLRARLRAARDGQAALRLQLIAAALDLRLLDALTGGADGTAALADRLGATDPDLLAGYLHVLVAAGLVAGDGSWALTRAGRAVVGDDQVRASSASSMFRTATSDAHRWSRSGAGSGCRSAAASARNASSSSPTPHLRPISNTCMNRTRGEASPPDESPGQRPVHRCGEGLASQESGSQLRLRCRVCRS